MICAVVALAPACTQDFDDSVNNVPMKTITLSASYELPEVFAEDGTRVTLNAKDQLVWEAGDAITVVYNGTQKAVSTALSEDDEAVGQTISESATFSVEIPEDATINYAFYSKSSPDGVEASQIRANFAGWNYSTNAQVWEGNNLAAGYSLADVIRLCVASGAVSYNPSSQNASVTLHNTTAFAEIQLKGSDKVWSVDLLSKSYNLRSKYGFVKKPASDEPYLETYQTTQLWNRTSSPMGGAHYAYTDNKGCQLSEEVSSFYFAMPIVNLPAEDLYIQVRTSNYTRLYKSKNGHSFTRNHVTRFAPITVKSIIDDHDYELLDANGVSNCYMIAPATTDKYYSFSLQNIDGTYQGGEKSIGAWPMWATKTGLVEEISVNYQTKRVYFKVPANSGNGSCMLNVGALNQSLIGTNWAWHIWITDATDLTYCDPAITVLDRALGAIWTPKSKGEIESMTGETAAQTVGFMYQYGRAIPFPGPKTLSAFAGTNKWGYEGSGDASGAKAFEANTLPVEKYRFSRWQHDFTTYDTTAEKGNKSMLGMKYYNMAFACGAGTWATDLTQSKIVVGGSADLWSATEKGMQDPCPQGYRVATYTELLKMFRRVIGSNEEVISKGNPSVYTDAYSTTNKGWKNANSANKNKKDYYGVCISNSTGQSNSGTVTDEKNAVKAAMGDAFVWLPQGGCRLQYKSNAANSVNDWGTSNNRYAGCLYMGGFYDNNDDGATYTSGKAMYWGTYDVDTTDSGYMGYLNNSGVKCMFMGHALTDYKNGVWLPFIQQWDSENVYTYKDLSGKGPAPANFAMPVRCVKLATANGEAQVASLAGQQNDTNTWK